MTIKPKTIAATGLLLAIGSIAPAQETTQIELPDGPSQHVPLTPMPRTLAGPAKELPAPVPVRLPAPIQVAPKSTPITLSTQTGSSPGQILRVTPAPAQVPQQAVPAQSCAVPNATPQSSCPSGACSSRPLMEKYRDKCGTREYFPTPALGESIDAHFHTQVDNGIAARMTFYDYDFICGTDRLNYRGKDRVYQIARWLPQNDFPVVIERTVHTPELAEARRLAVLKQLQELGPVEAQRVVVGIPLPYPLNGVEAELINLNFEQQTRAFGFPLY